MPGSDIFVSYKSEQLSWARRLALDLGRYGFTVFLDHDTAAGLQAGDAWEARLRQEILGAKHFLLLWSSKVVVNSYVLKELGIRLRANLPVTVVRLDDAPAHPDLDSSTQDFRDFVPLATGAPDDGADGVDFFEWHRAVRHLVEGKPLAEGASSVVVPVPLVVVAMTRSQAYELKAGTKIVSAIQGRAFDAMMGLLEQTVPFDPLRYGDRPEDWRPFAEALDPTDWTVEQVVAGLDDAKRTWQRDYGDGSRTGRSALVPFGAALRDPNTVDNALRHLKARHSLIVFDPLSLMHHEVYRDVMNNGLHTLEKAFVIGLGPQLAASSPAMRDYFGTVERELFNDLMMRDPLGRSRLLFQPTLNTCVFNVCQRFELARWLNIASEEIVATTGQQRTRMRPEYNDLVRRGPDALPRLG